MNDDALTICSLRKPVVPRNSSSFHIRSHIALKFAYVSVISSLSSYYLIHKVNNQAKQILRVIKSLARFYCCKFFASEIETSGQASEWHTRMGQVSPQCVSLRNAPENSFSLESRRSDDHKSLIAPCLHSTNFC